MKLKKLLLIPLVMLILLTVFQTVAAHPLGNFSINRYRHLTLNHDGTVSLLYIVDMAEIPAFREFQELDQNGDNQISEQEEAAYLDSFAADIGSQARLIMSQNPVEWTAVQKSLDISTGQGDLPVLRYELLFTGTTRAPEVGVVEATFEDSNFNGQVGWQEVIVSREGGQAFTQSSAPAEDLSNQLRDYPDNWLDNPPATSSATFAYKLNNTAVATEITQSEPLDGAETAVVTQPVFGSDEFANLLAARLDQPNAILLAFIIAIGMGAAHALTPGHGKTIVGAYLVGSRGTAKHALFLGLTTTLTHTIGVFAFGFLVLFASRFFLPEAFYPWLGVLSGLLVVLIGFSLFRERLKSWFNLDKIDHEGAEGYHTHFGIGHTHTPQKEPGLRNLFALGVSGGLIPCPSALILLLSAIALNKIGLGLLLILAFSIGLAGVLTGIGFALVYANRLFAKMPFSLNGRIGQAIPTLSALFITIAGLLITFQAISETTLF